MWLSCSWAQVNAATVAVSAAVAAFALRKAAVRLHSSSLPLISLFRSPVIGLPPLPTHSGHCMILLCLYIHMVNHTSVLPVPIFFTVIYCTKLPAGKKHSEIIHCPLLIKCQSCEAEGETLETSHSIHLSSNTFLCTQR